MSICGSIHLNMLCFIRAIIFFKFAIALQVEISTLAKKAWFVKSWIFLKKELNC